MGLIVLAGIIILVAWLYKETTKDKTPTYNEWQKPCCPRCGQSNYHVMVTNEVIRPGKTKTQSSINLNPLKPFTIMNHKEKVVRREITRNVSRFVCNECGNIFN